jgi:hypothetical protein
MHITAKAMIEVEIEQIRVIIIHLDKYAFLVKTKVENVNRIETIKTISNMFLKM